MSTAKPAKQSEMRPSKRVGYLVIGLSVVLAGLVIVGYAMSYRARILPRVQASTVSLAGLSIDQARERLATAANTVTHLTVVVDDQASERLALNDLGIFYDVPTTVSRAYALGKEGQWWVRGWQYLTALFRVTQLEPVVVTDQAKYQATLEEQLFKQYETSAQEVTLTVDKTGQVTPVAGKPGLVLNRDQLNQAIGQRLNSFSADPITLARQNFAPRFTVADATYAQRQAGKLIANDLTLLADAEQITVNQSQLGAWVTTQTVLPSDATYKRAVLNGQSSAEALLVVDINWEALLKYVKSLAFEQINTEPQDAGVRFADGKLEVFQPSKVGRQVKEEETVAAIYQALLDRAFDQEVTTVALVIAELPPTVTENSLTNLGIKELIGRAATEYSTSPANRKHNIAVGAKKMNGTILQNGEEFSAVKSLGEVDAANGYLPELVINNNALERQYGGGLCQPITTLFRAVLDAGLPVTDRSNHSRRVSYYEKASPVTGVRINWNSQYANLGGGLVGYDATVFIPAPDLKFKNDTGHAILIQAFVTDNKQVTYEIYGTNDGRTVAISKAQILYTKEPPQPQFQPDPSKPSNTMEQVAKPVPGAKASFTYTITYPDGRAEAQTFESIYRAIPAQYLVGTAEPQPVP